MRKTLIATVSAAAIALSSLTLSSCSSTRAYAGVDGSYELAPGTTAYYGMGYDGNHHNRPPKRHKPPKPPKKVKHNKPPKKAKHHSGKHRGHHHDD